MKYRAQGAYILVLTYVIEHISTNISLLFGSVSAMRSIFPEAIYPKLLEFLDLNFDRIFNLKKLFGSYYTKYMLEIFYLHTPMSI